MTELQTATDIVEPQRRDGCDWSTIVAGIRKYAEEQSPFAAADLNEWADLLESFQSLEKRLTR